MHDYAERVAGANPYADLVSAVLVGVRPVTTATLPALRKLSVDFLDQAKVVNLIQRNICGDFGLTFTLLKQSLHLRTSQGSIRSPHLLEHIVSIVSRFLIQISHCCIRLTTFARFPVS